MDRDERNEAHARIDAQLKRMIKGCERRILICNVIQVIAATATVWGIWNLLF